MQCPAKTLVKYIHHYVPTGMSLISYIFKQDSDQYVSYYCYL